MLQALLLTLALGSASEWVLGQHAEFKLTTISNLEPSPHVVRYAFRLTPPTMTGVDEGTAMYCRSDPTGTSNMTGCWYMEVTGEQQDTEAGGLKVIHFGHGDAVYIAGFADGPTLESANFSATSRGLIITNQWIPGTPNTYDFSLATMLNLVVGYDGTGGTKNPLAYGAIYVARAMGNSLHIRTQDPAQPGFAWGLPELSISNWDLQRDPWKVYNTGLTVLSSYLAATSGGPLQAAPALKMYGSYWTGAAAVDKALNLQPSMDGSGNPTLYLQMGTAGAETNEVLWQIGSTQQVSHVDALPSCVLASVGTSVMYHTGNTISQCACVMTGAATYAWETTHSSGVCS